MAAPTAFLDPATLGKLASANVWTANQTISNTAPALHLTDTTPSAKSLTIEVDGNKANFRESAGAAGSLLALDLTNNRVGILTNSPSFDIHLSSAKNAATAFVITNQIALGNTGASAQMVLQAQGASGYFGAFPNDHGIVAARDNFLVGANSDATAMVFYAPTASQTIRFYAGGTTETLRLAAAVLTISDAVDIAVNTGTGTKIGTAITQKLGFYNATPIAQRAGAAQAAVATTAATQTTPWGYATQAQADAIVTLANELRAWAVAQGFIKGAA